MITDWSTDSIWLYRTVRKVARLPAVPRKKRELAVRTVWNNSSLHPPRDHTVSPRKVHGSQGARCMTPSGEGTWQPWSVWSTATRPPWKSGTRGDWRLSTRLSTTSGLKEPCFCWNAALTYTMLTHPLRSCASPSHPLWTWLLGEGACQWWEKWSGEGSAWQSGAWENLS